MVSERSGFGVGFSKSIEAILGVVQTGHALGVTYIHPWEVRENLRLAGMRLDRNIAQIAEFPDPYSELEVPDDYQPDFGPEDPEEGYDVIDDGEGGE